MKRFWVVTEEKVIPQHSFYGVSYKDLDKIYHVIIIINILEDNLMILHDFS